MSTFGNRVRSCRLALGLRQADFSEHGITQSQLSLIEHGDVIPSAAKIDTLARLLNRSAADLVMGTEIQSHYEAAHLPSKPDDVPPEIGCLTRSQRLVALEESYRRIQHFYEVFALPQNAVSVTIDDEAYYQFAVRIYRRALESALEYDQLIAQRVFVLPSMIGEWNVDYASLRLALQRSVAYLTSLILEFPEAVTAASRYEIVKRIGLDRVDRFFERLTA